MRVRKIAGELTRRTRLQLARKSLHVLAPVTRPDRWPTAPRWSAIPFSYLGELRAYGDDQRARVLGMSNDHRLASSAIDRPKDDISDVVGHETSSGLVAITSGDVIDLVNPASCRAPAPDGITERAIPRTRRRMIHRTYTPEMLSDPAGQLAGFSLSTIVYWPGAAGEANSGTAGG